MSLLKKYKFNRVTVWTLHNPEALKEANRWRCTGCVKQREGNTSSQSPAGFALTVCFPPIAETVTNAFDVFSIGFGGRALKRRGCEKKTTASAPAELSGWLHCRVTPCRLFCMCNLRAARVNSRRHRLPFDICRVLEAGFLDVSGGANVKVKSLSPVFNVFPWFI